MKHYASYHSDDEEESITGTSTPPVTNKTFTSNDAIANLLRASTTVAAKQDCHQVTQQEGLVQHEVTVTFDSLVTRITPNAQAPISLINVPAVEFNDFNMSQISCEEKMLKSYEESDVMKEVIGSQSLLSQEIVDHEMNNSSKSNRMPAPAVTFHQSQEWKPQFLRQASLEQSHQSMSISSLPSLPISQPHSIQNTPISHAISLSQTSNASAGSDLITEAAKNNNNNVAKKPMPNENGNLLVPRTDTAKSVTSNSTLNTSGLSNPKKRPIDTSGADDIEYNPKKSNTQDTEYTVRRAVDLIQKLAGNKKLEKQLLLSLTLARGASLRAGSEISPPSGTKLRQGFQWSQFPPLEKFLRDHMEEYYELSIEKCQSVLQQEFNNRLVKKVLEIASRNGWKFEDFAYKTIRDRVRCYFKTHMQNAKKRVKTMCKNPFKKANAKALAAHLDLIERHNETRQELELATNLTKDRGIEAKLGVEADNDEEDAVKVVSGARMCIDSFIYIISCF